MPWPMGPGPVFFYDRLLFFEPVQKKLVRGSGGPGWAGSWAGSCDGSTAIEGNPFVEQFGKGMPLMDQLAHGSVCF